MLKDEKIKKILKKNLKATIQNKAICFLPGNRLPIKTAQNTLLGKVQDLLKKHGRLYYFLINVFTPVLPSQAYRKNLLELLKKYDEGKVVLNLGSGPTYIYRRTDIVNIDLFAFDEVDIVADVTDLPIEDDSVDLIINTALIEHVDEPQKVVEEMARVLRGGGEIFCYLPFIAPYHAAPHDFYRWTIPGIQKLFAEFQSVEIKLGAGPTSGMLWVFQEWLAILLSFGSQKLHDVIFMILMVLTAPIKLLDLLLEKFPCAEKIACGFYVIGKKKDS